MTKTLHFLILFIFFYCAAIAQTGIPDPSFGNGAIAGTDTFSHPAAPTFEQAILIQPDGKILVTSGGDNLALGRLHSDGSPDLSFGTSHGWVNAGNSIFGDLQLQFDSNIIVAGRTTNGQGQTMVLKYTSTGQIDNSFGVSGMVVDANMIGSYEHVAVQPDGYMVWTTQNAMTRLDPFGTTDPSFGLNATGYNMVVGDVPLASFNALTVDSLGFIYVAGVSTDYFLSVVRLVPSGAVDQSFGFFGLAKLPLTVRDYNINMTVKVTSAGKIILVSDTADLALNSNSNKVVIGQYNYNGSIDSSFGTDGIVFPIWSTQGSNEHLGGAAIRPDGKIAVAATIIDSAAISHHSDIALLVINTNGRQDTIFGIAKLDINHNQELAGAVAVDTYNRPVVCGGSGNWMTVSRFTAAFPAGLNGPVNDETVISIYPNPTSGSATLTHTAPTEDELSISIISVEGKTIEVISDHEKISSGTYQKDISTEGMAPGMYFIKISTSANTSISRFVKQ
jgi:uncharacterized delta-60 repeat protein